MRRHMILEINFNKTAAFKVSFTGIATSNFIGDISSWSEL